MRIALSTLYAFCFVQTLIGQPQLPEYVSPEVYKRMQSHTRSLVLDAPEFCASCCRWTTPLRLDPDAPGAQFGGHIASDDSGNIFVAWGGFIPQGTDQAVVIGRSSDRGLNWQRTYYLGGQNISRDAYDIAVDHSGNIWLLWESLQSEFSSTYLNLSKSTDGGLTFTTLFRSLSYSGGRLQARLALDEQNSVYILWDDAQFKVTKFQYGNISDRTDAIVPHSGLSVSMNPRLTVSKDFIVHVAWEGFFYDPPTGYHIFVFYSSSMDTGRTFGGGVRVDTVDRVGDFYAHEYPAISVDDIGRIFVSYSRTLSWDQADVRIVRSIDGGISFSSPYVVSDSLAYEAVLSVDSPEDGVNIIWGGQRGVFHRRSIDGGMTFGPPSQVGMTAVDVHAMPEGELLAAGPIGIKMYFTKTDVLDSVDPTSVPSSLVLSNYPNPFNSTTVLRFNLSLRAHATLTIFDVLGREVEVLMNQAAEPGEHALQWNPGMLSSGLYIARLDVQGTRCATAKIMLIR